MERLELLAGIEAVQKRHADVDDHDVRLQLAGHLQQRPSIRHPCDHVEIDLQEVLERLRHQHMVVGDQNASALHAALISGAVCWGDGRPSWCFAAAASAEMCSDGTHTSMVVPRDGAESMRMFLAAREALLHADKAETSPALELRHVEAFTVVSDREMNAVGGTAHIDTRRFAWLCLATLFRLSSVTRNRHRATSAGTGVGSDVCANSTGCS